MKRKNIQEFKKIMECFGFIIYDMRQWDKYSPWKEGEALAMRDGTKEFLDLHGWEYGARDTLDIGVHHVVKNIADKFRVTLEWVNESILGAYPENLECPGLLEIHK
jgi:hypothetical protein